MFAYPQFPPGRLKVRAVLAVGEIPVKILSTGTRLAYNGGPTSVGYQDLSPADLFARCAEPGNDAAWAEFLRRYHRTIAGAVVKTLAARNRNSRDEAEEMTQEVYTKLCGQQCRVLCQFSHREPNSDFAYLKTVAINAVLDRLRKLRAERPEGGLIPLEFAAALPAVPDCSRELLVTQLHQAALAGATDRDRLIFNLFYQTGLSAAEISRLASVELTAKGVESVLHRLTALVRGKFGPAGEGNSPEEAS